MVNSGLVEKEKLIVPYADALRVLVVKQWSKRDLLNLPPDRTMYGRAFWTFMHTVSVYLPHSPSLAQNDAFKGPCGSATVFRGGRV